MATAYPLYAHAQPSDAQPASFKPQRSSPRLREPFASADVVPTWYAPLAQAQFTETLAAGRAVRYAARPNSASALVVSYSDVYAPLTGFTLTSSISMGRQG
jgi:hypothetical protein